MAAAVVREGREICSSVVSSQVEVHSPYGGVVPELASRDHARVVSQVAEQALDEAGVKLSDLAGIAVTAGPGLVGSLLVGLSFAKALAYRAELPLVAVHHLAGHLAAAELSEPTLIAPYMGLVVSGGHTALYRVEEEGPPRLLGETRDDAVGEAFDKVAKLLGLGFPGGPAVSAAAQSGNPTAVDFPRPMSRKAGLDFSFSGLKTAVALEVQRRGGQEALGESGIADVAASFEAAAVDSLVVRSRRALKSENLDRLAVVGGVAANRVLRERLEDEGRKLQFEVIFPPPSLCTDNAVMIAAAGSRALARGERDGWSVSAFSRVPVGETPWRGGAE
ncbi:MAG: tRNA (adenosine(37)-N6)-threonylcarbamoyltransferase complex transferase subunit TsaD [Deltaproteobacteria bacterium]|nr:tRNA (adenosine(37)-N6)-threonylcarbamoyltransferase complex transferase subunit TsaD [Deltaproteobacteria bacterium]